MTPDALIYLLYSLVTLWPTKRLLLVKLLSNIVSRLISMLLVYVATLKVKPYAIC